MDAANAVAAPHRIELELSVSGGRCAFLAGEKISLRVTASAPAHIAILIHQSDGRRVVAFPNAWDRDSYIPGGGALEIPRPGSFFELESGPPFGTDLVEAIAFPSKEALTRMLRCLALSPSLPAGPLPDPLGTHAPSGHTSLLLGSFASPGTGPALKRPACIGSGNHIGIHGRDSDIAA